MNPNPEDEMDLHQLPSQCFDYRKPPAAIIPPFDFLDLDIALVDAHRRTEVETREINLLNNPATGTLMEYVLLAPKKAS